MTTYYATVEQQQFNVLVEWTPTKAKPIVEDITPKNYLGSLYRITSKRSKPSSLVVKKYIVKADETITLEDALVKLIGTVQDITLITGGLTMSYKGKILDCSMTDPEPATGLPDSKDSIVTVTFDVELER